MVFLCCTMVIPKSAQIRPWISHRVSPVVSALTTSTCRVYSFPAQLGWTSCWKSSTWPSWMVAFDELLRDVFLFGRLGLVPHLLGEGLQIWTKVQLLPSLAVGCDWGMCILRGSTGGRLYSKLPTLRSSPGPEPMPERMPDRMQDRMLE